MTISADAAAAAAWAWAYINRGLNWIEGEASIFSHGVVTQLKLELPAIEAAVVKALEDLAAQVVSEMETLYSNGDLKWSNGMASLIGVIENAGVAGMKMALSQTTKEAILQDAVIALKAGLIAAAAVSS